MARRTLLDEIAPFSSFAKSIDAGVALGGAWSTRKANEFIAVERVARLLDSINEGKLSDAAAQSKRVVTATDLTMRDIELLAYIDSTNTDIENGTIPARESLLELRGVANALSTNSSLPVMDGVPQVAELSDSQIVGIVEAMAKLGATDATEVERSLLVQIQARIRAFHAYTILSTARGRGAKFPAITASEGDLRDRAFALRDDVRSAARRAADADAKWFFEVVGIVAQYENEWEREVGDPCIALLVAGTERGATIAERRSAALAYDAIRLGLTWLAGVYILLLAWARSDNRALKEWAARSELPLSSGRLDLPRARVSAVASGDVPIGSEVEVAGIVYVSTSEAQGGRMRTVVRLDDELTVYFPFSAVNGFGLLPGVWCQARGTVIDESKGGYAAPTLRVRRRRLGQAAEGGFGEYLEYQGRTIFDRMRAGNDAVAGRLAHDVRTANEAADWN